MDEMLQNEPYSMSAYVSECTLVHIDTPTVGRRKKQVTHRGKCWQKPHKT